MTSLYGKAGVNYAAPVGQTPMGKHTAGPIWVSDTSGKPDIHGWKAAGAGNEEIAFFRNPHDARLFKAASDMLAVLRRVHADCDALNYEEIRELIQPVLLHW